MLDTNYARAPSFGTHRSSCFLYLRLTAAQATRNARVSSPYSSCALLKAPTKMSWACSGRCWRTLSGRSSREGYGIRTSIIVGAFNNAHEEYRSEEHTSELQS